MKEKARLGQPIRKYGDPRDKEVGQKRKENFESLEYAKKRNVQKPGNERGNF